MSMLPPTIATITDIAAHPTVADVLAAGLEREVSPVMPKVLLDADDKVRFLLPHDPDYPREPVG
jgi:altronate dehydratase